MFALVARGSTTHWKAVVGWVFTGLSTDKHKLWAFIVEAMRHLKRKEISTVGYSSDMGPCNTVLWSLNGVYANESGVVTSRPHPVEEGKRLFFLPDVSHVMKNIWCQLLRCEYFLLPPDTVTENSLPSDKVQMEHVRQLYFCQGAKGGVKILPELMTEHVNPSQFEKMRANIAGSFSERMSAGLSFAAIHVPEVSREAESTGWFVGQVSECKRLMNARHEFDSLSPQGRERVKFL